jgi:eukaryotic-like serine/threonine-protein kinase
MLKTIRSFRLGTVGTIVAVLGLLLSFIPVQAVRAQSNPYTPTRVCNNEAPGSGYYVQRSHALNGARVYQLYNGSYNCVVTIKTVSIGSPTLTNACVQVTGTGWNCNKGDFKYYAGAVWYYGKGKCVKYFGYHGGTNYESPWGNCR